MPDEQASTSGTRKSFFTSLPGILTGTAALITAVGTIVGIVVATGGNGHRTAVSSTLPTAASVSFPTSTGIPVTLEGWASQADAICRESEARVQGARQEVAHAATVQDEVSAETRFVAIGEIVLSRLRALDMPPDSRADIEHWLSLWDQQFSQMANAASVLATSNDPASYTASLEGTVQRNNEIDRLGAQLGAFRCVSG